MNSRAPQMYLHPGMTMMGESHIGSVPGSIPINVPMGIPTTEVTGMTGVRMSGNHPIFSRKAEPSEMPQQQQQYSQLPLRKEVYDEGRFIPEKEIYDEGRFIPETSTSEVLPETSAPHPSDINDAEPEGLPLKVKTEEEEEIDSFMKAAYDIFLQISSKEITLKQGADKLERPYSFVYTRYQEFCDKITGCDTEEPKIKKKTAKKKKGRGRKRRKRKANTRHSGSEVYQCPECPAVHYTEYLSKTHAKVHVEGNESHLCTACGVVFPKLNKLMQHRVESHEEALQCPHCDSRFTTVINYKAHILTHTVGKPYKCDECGKGFSKNYYLMNHKRSHTGEKPFMCGFCGKTFSTLTAVKSHRYVHTGGQNKPFECELCGQRYTFNSALMDHMNTHTGAKPYVCEICDARFNFKANLRCHKMTHEGEGSHKCDLCPAAFYRSIDLKNHKVSHTGLKPFKCDLCDYSCTRKSNMEFHKNTHTGETPFKCDFYGCNAEYARPNSLKKHKLKHGPPPPQQCKVCHEKFTDLIALKHHMMAHTGEKPHTCDQCFKTFVDIGALKRHTYTHMYRPFAEKTKQVRQSKKNPQPKKVNAAPIPTASFATASFGNPPMAHKKWPNDGYQVPIIAENGHSSQGLSVTSQGLTVMSQGLPSSSHGLTSSSQGLPTTVSVGQHGWNINTEYTNLVNLNTAWPSTMDPEELRRRLLHSFK